MSEFTGERFQERIEDVDCPLCGKGKVWVTFTAGYMTWNVSRISAGAKRTRYYHEPKTRVHGICPACKASREEIREALEKGRKCKASQEERLIRIREAGLPTRIDVPQ